MASEILTASCYMSNRSDRADFFKKQQQQQNEIQPKKTAMQSG